MTERPIIFSGPMVRAILDGRKTQTRRPVKVLYGRKRVAPFAPYYVDEDGVLLVQDEYGDYHRAVEALACPYGGPGDRLWIKETFTISACDADLPDLVYRADRAARQYRSTDTLAPVSEIYYFASNWEPRDGVKWHPSIYMSRDMSRLTLEVTGVRVERVQAISEEDARAEGITADVGVAVDCARCNRPKQPRGRSAAPEMANGLCDPACPAHYDDPHPGDLWPGESRDDFGFGFAARFAPRWDAIYAKRGFGWLANPWVWVVEFRRLP